MPIQPAAAAAVFSPPAGQDSFDEATLDAMELCYHENGFVVLRNVFAAELMDRMEAECVRAQQQVVAHELSERYGSTVFLDDAAKADRFANYVEYINELSPAVVEATAHPNLLTALRRLLSEDCWMRDASQFGVVYQDARPGKESGYTRIGWHSDWQAGPSLTIWPSTAFTFHIDGTSPENGFLRVVPGSHRWATPAPYRNVNDIEVPEGAAAADLWHSAARATAEDTTRRHVRGGYFAGDRANEGVEQFLKNAAR
jgi:ectoine hydroxylase-related dioxygenase (phytanoyl-CoA dioxygenase family)